MCIAVPDDDEQVGVLLLRAAREFGSQAGLAEAGFTGHETGLSLPSDHQLEPVAELL